jgi:hypothetical protein
LLHQALVVVDNSATAVQAHNWGAAKEMANHEIPNPGSGSD